MEKAGIYVHIPFCKSKCSYCSFCSTTEMSLQTKYFYRLKMEIKQTTDILPVDTVYIGGGTPSMAKRGFLTETVAALREKFDLSTLNEFTVECNPDSVSYAFLSEIRRLGVNRLSMGLQSASDDVLQTAGRAHSVSQFVEAVRKAKSFGITNISGDLILGLPGQTFEDIDNAIAIFFDNGIEHISVYALSVEEGTPLYSSGYKTDDDMQADMYEYAVEKLKEKDYDRYEVSNFCRNGKIAKHNYKYWVGADYYGFGAAAHSLINGVRYENTSDICLYTQGKNTVLSSSLNADDIREELIMLRLRTAEGLSLSEYENKCGENLLVAKKNEIKKLLDGRLIEIAGGRLCVTDEGFYLLNTIITELI